MAPLCAVVLHLCTPYDRSSERPKKRNEKNQEASSVRTHTVGLDSARATGYLSAPPMAAGTVDPTAAATDAPMAEQTAALMVVLMADSMAETWAVKKAVMRVAKTADSMIQTKLKVNKVSSR